MRTVGMRVRRWALAPGVAVGVALVWAMGAGAVATFPAGSTRLVSGPSGSAPFGPGETNTSNVFGAERAVSPDGRYVAFESTADGLSTEDDDRFQNVFVKDLQTGQVLLVSRATGLNGAPADGTTADPSISVVGNVVRVAFLSFSASLDPADTNGNRDIYVRDLTAGTTTLVSRANGLAGVVGNGRSEFPSISRDGARVAFESEATNLDGADTDSDEDIYVRVLATGATILASRATGAGGASGNGRSFAPSLNQDGTKVAFASTSTNLHADDGDTAFDIFRRDLTATTTDLVSRADGAAGAAANGFSQDASINGDGTRVAFESSSTNLTAEAVGGIFVRDVSGGTTALASRADGAVGAPDAGFAQNPSLSASGTRVAWETSGSLDPADAGSGDVYVRDLATNATILASRPTGAATPSAGGSSPALSDDGTTVAFDSSTDSLSNEDDDDYGQVFARNLTAATTVLVSRPAGAQPFTGAGVAFAGLPTFSAHAISADGRFIVFSSLSDALSSEDDNTVPNVFVRDTLTGQTILVSRANGLAGQPANGRAGEATISADGRRVAFESSATNLSPDDPSTDTDVFVRDLVTGETILASRADGQNGTSASIEGGAPTISGDGSRVAFQTSAGLSADDTNGFRSDVYVRDLAAGTTTLASRATGPSGQVTNEDSTQSVISTDGTRVAFATAGSLDAIDTNARPDVYLRDLAAATTTLVSRADGAGGAIGNDASEQPALSADATRVAFATSASNLNPADPNTTSDVHVRDLVAGTTTLASRADGASGLPGNGASERPSLSANGTRVAFMTLASNLNAADADTFADVHVRDLATGTTTLASRADGLAGAVSDSSIHGFNDAGPALNASGTCVALGSFAGNFDPAHYVGGRDHQQIYLRTLAGECPLSPPETSIDTGPTGAIATATATFTFSADEAGSTFACALDAASFSPCSSPLTTGPLAAGPHALQVRATDPAGNADTTPASRNFSVTPPPAPSPAPPAPARTLQLSLGTFTLAANGTMTIRVRCPAAAATRCKGTVTLVARIKKSLLGPTAKKVPVTLLTKRFTIPAGTSAAVSKRLSKAHRALLLRARTLPATLTVTAADAAGSKRSLTKKVALKAPAT